MQQPEDYRPTVDRDGFITKSILTIGSVLQKARTDGRGGRGAAPSVKLFYTLLFIVLISCAQNMFFVYCMAAGILLRCCFLPAGSLLKCIRTALLAACFSALLLLPAVFLGSPRSMLTISCKVFLSVCLVMQLASTTPWNRVTEGLRAYHVPDLFIFTLDLTLKYIVMLGDFCLAALEALRLRSVGKNRSQSKSFSGILGVTFMKSQQMAEETYQAMTCRCFTGEYRKPEKSGLTGRDLLCLLLCGGAVTLFLFLEFAM